MDIFEASSSNNDVSSQLKKSLTPYKLIIPNLHAFFTWKKQYYPLLISAYITFSYLLIWLLELSVLSTVSIIGLVVTLVDFFLPTVVASFCDSSKWSDKDEEKFDHVCNELSCVLSKLKSSYNCWNEMRQNKSKIYYVSIFSALLTLAWIGNTFNNLFLVYVLTLTTALLPGLKHHQVFSQGFEKGLALIKSTINKEKKDN